MPVPSLKREIDQTLIEDVRAVAKHHSSVAKITVRSNQHPLSSREAFTYRFCRKRAVFPERDLVDGRLWDNVLLPAVCHGDVDLLRSSLYRLAVGDRQVGRLMCSFKGPRLALDKARNNREHFDHVIRGSMVVRNIINKVHGERLTLLHAAVQTRSLATVQALLSWRADPSIFDHHHYVTPLWLAAALGELEIVAALIASKAAIMPSTQSGIFPDKGARISPWLISLGNVQVFETLHDNGSNTIPILEAVVLLLFGSGDIARRERLCYRPGAVHWHDRFLFADQFLSVLLRYPAARQILSMPSVRDDDVIGRTVLFQYLLVQMIRRSDLMDFEHVNCLLADLVQGGASPIGWSSDRLGHLEHLFAWVSRPNQEECEFFPWEHEPTPQSLYSIDKSFWSCTPDFVCDDCVRALDTLSAEQASNGTESRIESPSHRLRSACILPVVTRYCTTDGDTADDVVKIFATVTDTPWLPSLSDLPWADGKLHNGPTCDHANLTQEQRRVPLLRLTCEGSGVVNLASLSKSAVLASLKFKGRQTMVTLIRQLPIPEHRKIYLLS